MKKVIGALLIMALGLILVQPPPVEAEPIVLKEYPLLVRAEPILIEETPTPTSSEFKPYEFIPLSDDLQIHLNRKCEEMGIDFFLGAALMESESSFIEDAISEDGKDIGLFQIRASVWQKHFEEMDLDIHEPTQNIECGLHILKDLLDKYPVETALQCYKCGETRGLELLREGIKLGVVDDILARQKEWQRKEPH
ncbi:MAG: transglycosylase SLT domain-containing protein [Lachnospiraceae bacterium]|nr:transglycosylase SLT domain-containing protein [Lachnospiraceae bacterium]